MTVATLCRQDSDARPGTNAGPRLKVRSGGWRIAEKLSLAGDLNCEHVSVAPEGPGEESLGIESVADPL